MPSVTSYPRARRASALLGLATALVAGVLSTPAPASAAPEPGAPGIGDSYFPLDGNGGIDVLRYRIHDRYRFASGRLSGRTRLTVRATDDLSSFNLDFLLPVRSVRIDGDTVDHSKPVKHELTVVPNDPIQTGDRFDVVVRYAGRPDAYGYLGERNWLADRREVVAMNQPHMSTWWFPANDHPSDKALMDISITVPRDKQVFANGARVSRVRHGKVVTHRFTAAEPMSTYLAMFAAGDFAVDRGERGGLPWTAIVSRQLGPRSRESNLDLMRRTPRVVEALEGDLGDYPFETVGGLVTGLPINFALENQTLPTYPALGRGYSEFVVHEIAHQWFGDSVALRRWRDIWLNEGAATFMEVRWDETHGGPTGKTWLCQSYADRPESSSFWDLEIGDPGAGHIFAGPVYYRGAMVFQALRNRIGSADYWALLQRWVEERADGTGTRAQFERLAEDVSGRQLDEFFRVWLDVGSKPADVRANGLGCVSTQ